MRPAPMTATPSCPSFLCFMVSIPPLIPVHPFTPFEWQRERSHELDFLSAALIREPDDNVVARRFHARPVKIVPHRKPARKIAVAVGAIHRVMHPVHARGDDEPRQPRFE